MSTSKRCTDHDCAMHHKLHAESDGHRITLVGDGPRAYLWFAPAPHGSAGFISGPTTLRKLAKAILKEVGE